LKSAAAATSGSVASLSDDEMTLRSAVAARHNGTSLRRRQNITVSATSDDASEDGVSGLTDDEDFEEVLPANASAVARSSVADAAAAASAVTPTSAVAQVTSAGPVAEPAAVPTVATPLAAALVLTTVAPVAAAEATQAPAAAVEAKAAGPNAESAAAPAVATQAPVATAEAAMHAPSNSAELARKPDATPARWEDMVTMIRNVPNEAGGHMGAELAPPRQEDWSHTTPKPAAQNESNWAGAYAAGDQVQVLDINGGPTNGTWTAAVILARGQDADMYDIRVPAAPADLQDYKNVDSQYLRRAPPPEPQQPAPEATYTYEVGDSMEVLSTSGNRQWVPCSITEKGTHSDTYTIHVPMLAEGHREVNNVPASKMRPYDPVKYAQVLEHFKYDTIRGAHYKIGDNVEMRMVKGPFVGRWFPCNITSYGRNPQTYNVRVKYLEGSEQDLQDIHYISLRPVPQYGSGDLAEVQVRDGPEAGTWVKVNVTRKGSFPNTYVINTGKQEIKDIHAVALRRVRPHILRVAGSADSA